MYNEILTWIAMVEIPVFATVFRLITKNKREYDNTQTCLKDSFNDFKLHVARNYVAINYLKDVENRLTNHLLRIEKKLDETRRAR